MAKKDKNNTDATENTLKEVEYYAALVQAWFNTRFEFDKSLLMLSSGGAGLVATLMTTSGTHKPMAVFVCAVISVLFFLICIGSMLFVFRMNAQYLERVIIGQNGESSFLKCLDMLGAVSFLIGTFALITMGIFTYLFH